MAKGRSVFPSSPAPMVVCLSLAPTQTCRHTQTGKKMTVLAKQERCKKTPVNTHQGWKYTDINRPRRK